MGAPSAAPPPAPAPERELFAEVALPLPLRREFTYRIPPGLGDRVRPGVRVQVMFGRRPDVGVVTALRSECAWSRIACVRSWRSSTTPRW